MAVAGILASVNITKVPLKDNVFVFQGAGEVRSFKKIAMLSPKNICIKQNKSLGKSFTQSKDPSFRISN